MIVISATPYHLKLTDAYYNKILQENIDYLEKNGVGPYEYNGKFTTRVQPWLDSGYWMNYDKWLKSEFNIIHASGFNELHFETEEEAMWFVLKMS